MNLISAGIPVRTVDTYRILHDKVIIASKRNTEVGSFNFSRAADRANSENVLVVWDDLLMLNAICSTGRHAGRRERTVAGRTDNALNDPRT